MPIAFVSYTAQSTSGPGTTITNSLDAGSDANRVLICGVTGHTTSDEMTAATYNGVSMTKIGVVKNPGDGARYIYLWMLVNPASGTNDLVYTNNSSVFCFSGATVLSGVSAEDTTASAKTKTATSGSTYNHSITTVADNCWLVGFTSNNGNNISAGANTTLREASASAVRSDTNAAQTPAGAYDLNWSATSAEWASVVTAVAPVVVTTSSSSSSSSTTTSSS